MESELVPCPHCGADIDADARFCRHCGSSDSDGWADDSYADGGYGEDDFDYDAFVENEFPEQSESGGVYTETKPHWRLVSVILLIAFVLGVLTLIF